MTITVNIFGSCVTRDALEFADGVTVGKYCGRQSIASAVSTAAAPQTLERLEFKKNVERFHLACVREDFDKTALDRLAERAPDEIVVVDLIEERKPIGVTRCGTLVSYSDAAAVHSNAGWLIDRTIAPWSVEHVQLFTRSITEFAERLRGRPVVVHRALYAEDQQQFARCNSVLNYFYGLAVDCLDPVAVIDPPASCRKTGTNHKWGAAPYHYVDPYYQNFVRQFAERLHVGVVVKEGFTLQKTETAEEAATAPTT